MKKFFLSILILSILFVMGCQAFDDKSQAIIKKENEKLSKFLHQPESELKIIMGSPDRINYDEKGAKFLVYVSKKYNITCERKFEIDQSKMVIGVSSRGCF